MAVTTAHAAMHGCLGFNLQCSFLFFTKYSVFVSTLFFFIFALNGIQKDLFLWQVAWAFCLFFTLTFDWDTTKLHFLNKKEKEITMTVFSLFVVVKLHNERKKSVRWYMKSPMLFLCAWSFRIQTTVTVNTKHGSGLACFSYQNAAALFEANESRDDFLANTHFTLGCVWFFLLNFSRCPIECLIHAWSIKYRLITKLIAQFATNLRDESFKPN